MNQRIGLATSPGPHGPWTRRDAPILSPSNGSAAWDNLFVTNPGPYIYPNGSVLLVYKAKGTGAHGMLQGVAFADHWSGPYRRLTPKAPIVMPVDCEDPGIYRDPARGLFRMVLHCGCSVQLMWSLDGVSWTEHGSKQTQGWCTGFNYTDGGAGGRLKTRQRPKWVIDVTGAATHLMTGVNRPGDAGMGHTWTMANVLLNSTR